MDNKYDLFKDIETFKLHDLLMDMLDFTDDSDSDYEPSSSESESDSEDDTVPERKMTHIDPKNILPLS